jgi:hypothetical protein
MQPRRPRQHRRESHPLPSHCAGLACYRRLRKPTGRVSFVRSAHPSAEVLYNTLPREREREREREKLTAAYLTYYQELGSRSTTYPSAARRTTPATRSGREAPARACAPSCSRAPGGPTAGSLAPAWRGVSAGPGRGWLSRTTALSRRRTFRYIGAFSLLVAFSRYNGTLSARSR